ncbi:phosphatase PAP2 family protein [soil metagenome]
MKRVPAMGIFALAFAAWVALVGMPADPFQTFVWLWLGTVAWNFGAPWRQHLAFGQDWWPVFALLVIYLYSRGLSDDIISMPIHWTPPIRIDTWLGGGTLPTARLQDWLCAEPCTPDTPPRWYDVVLTTVYFSHFVTGIGLAVILWVRSRAAWVPWMRRYLVINFSALIVYVLYPMAPPWLASNNGYTDQELPRLTARGWDVLGFDGFHAALASVGNPVAAMPSLHSGIAMLVALYGVQKLRSRWRWALLAYPLAMGFALVYFAEHYVIDIFAGWALAALVLTGCYWWERHRAANAPTPQEETLDPQADHHVLESEQ